MGYPFRDDCPSEYSLFRRDFIVGGGVLMGLTLLPGAFSASANSASAVPAVKFMDISSLLINHKLDRDIGDRLAAAMSSAYPGIERDIDEILTIARNKNAKIVEDFFPDIPAGKLRDTALAIISAWYSGVISEAPGAEVYAFELALMYQPTRDVMTIPSYAISRPNGLERDLPSFVRYARVLIRRPIATDQNAAPPCRHIIRLTTTTILRIPDGRYS